MRFCEWNCEIISRFLLVLSQSQSGEQLNNHFPTNSDVDVEVFVVIVVLLLHKYYYSIPNRFLKSSNLL